MNQFNFSSDAELYLFTDRKSRSNAKISKNQLGASCSKLVVDLAFVALMLIFSSSRSSTSSTCTWQLFMVPSHCNVTAYFID